MKRLLSMILAICLLLACVSIPAGAAEEAMKIGDAALRTSINVWLGKADRGSGNIYLSEVKACKSIVMALRPGVKSLAGLDAVLKNSKVSLILLGTGQSFPDLSGLKGATNLTHVFLPDHAVKDVSALSTLTNLKELTAYGSKITDPTALVNAVKNLKKLTALRLESNAIVNLKPLSVLKGLTELSLANNKIVDITPLATLTKLKILTLAGNPIKNITTLAKLTALTTLSFSCDAVTDRTPIKKLTLLTDLRLTGKNIKNFTFLAKPANLKKLTVIDSGLTDLTFVSTLTGLEDLAVSGNFITNVTPLAKLSKLKTVDVSNNYITSLAPIKGKSYTYFLCGMNYIPVADTSAIKVSNAMGGSWRANQRRLFATDAAFKNVDKLTVAVNKTTTLKVLDKITQDYKTYKTVFTDEEQTKAEGLVASGNYTVVLDAASAKIVSVTKANGAITIKGLKKGTAKVTLLSRNLNTTYTRHLITVTVP